MILRHDVDKKPGNALKMAELEDKSDIRSTYYFRTKNNVFIEDIITRIYEIGHEIGFHYEVLAKSNGKYENAIELFGHELKKFNAIVPIDTISMLGSPKSKWNDLDLWKKYDYKEFGIMGDAVLYNHGDLRAIFTHKRIRKYPCTGGLSTLRVSVRNKKRRTRFTTGLP